jgi:hypothetical protein
LTVGRRGITQGRNDAGDASDRVAQLNRRITRTAAEVLAKPAHGYLSWRLLVLVTLR